MLRVDRCGEALDLLTDRAMYWPRTRTLIVADVHLGKDAAFRRAGLAVPQGATPHDLDRLATLITRMGAERLLAVSKGEESPVCFEENEDCWQQNRRGHPIVTAK